MSAQQVIDMKSHMRGFTLMELMITVVIIGILAAIAYPGYRNYMIQTRRSDAHVTLSHLANLQERFFTRCSPGHYASTLVGPQPVCGTGPNYDNGILGVANDLSTDQHYRITLTAGTIGAGCTDFRCGFTLLADPDHASTTGRQAGNGDLRLDARGQKNWDKANNNSFSAKWTDK